MVEPSKPDFGMKMKRLREERGVSLRQIADNTKLSVAALEAFERNDISRLPGGIFSRAFVRSYAIEVGLDPEKTLREFFAQFPHDSVNLGSPQAPPEDYTSGAGTGRRTFTVVAVVAILVIGAILYLMLSRP